MAVAYQHQKAEEGYAVISWQGVRRDESQNRKDAKKIERLAEGMFAFRPLIKWTAKQVFEYHANHNIKPNPLYSLGMTRVGCMPCINVNKAELRQISSRFPEIIERIVDWEYKVGCCSKRGFSTLICKKDNRPDRREIFASLNIRSSVQWSKTTRGGKQGDILSLLEPRACASSYGLCE